MSIPKVIHYVWLSGDKKPKPVKKCLASWRKVCPDYEIKEWTAADLDMEANSYVRQTYAMKKWSWLTDYFRLWILYNYGGIYLDSDVEVLKPFDPFLLHKAFTGFESNDEPPTPRIEAAVIGAEAGLPVFAELLNAYESIDYEIKPAENGFINFPIIPVLMAKTLFAHGLKRERHRQSAAGVEVYPADYFSGLRMAEDDWKTVTITENSHTVHRYLGSWLSEAESVVRRFIHTYGRIWKPMLILLKPRIAWRLFKEKRKRKKRGAVKR